MTEVNDVWQSLTGGAFAPTFERFSEISNLVHYTSFQSFKSIFEGDEIWFSSVLNMNDVGEVRRGKEVLENECRCEGSTCNTIITNLRENFPEVLEEINSSYERRFLDDLFNVFITCWSNIDRSANEHDDLFMWRSYAAEGNGVAISIDPKKMLLGGIEFGEILVCPVFYETEHNLVKRFERTLSDFYERLKLLDGQLISRNIWTVAQAFHEVIFYVCITHKHPAFRPEREWRFVWRKDRDDNEKYLNYLRPNIRNDELIEFFCFPLKNDPEIALGSLSISEIVDEIMIGPSDKTAQKASAIENILRRKGIPKGQIAVTHSDIPFRSNR